MDNIKSPPEKLRAKRAKKIGLFCSYAGGNRPKTIKKVTNIKIPELKIWKILRARFEELEEFGKY